MSSKQPYITFSEWEISLEKARNRLIFPLHHTSEKLDRFPVKPWWIYFCPGHGKANYRQTRARSKIRSTKDLGRQKQNSGVGRNLAHMFCSCSQVESHPHSQSPWEFLGLEDLQGQCLVCLGDSFWCLRILTVRKFGFVSKFRLVAHPFPLTLISGGDGAHPVSTCEGCHQNSHCPSCPSLSASGHCSWLSLPLLLSLTLWAQIHPCLTFKLCSSLLALRWPTVPVWHRLPGLNAKM